MGFDSMIDDVTSVNIGSSFFASEEAEASGKGRLFVAEASVFGKIV